MKVTVYGGGNIGTKLATHFAETGNEVTMFISKPQKFREHLTVVDQDGNIIHAGNLDLATNDAKKAFESAELILVTVPAFAIEKAAKMMLPFLKPGVMIGIIPGNGGGEAAFKPAIKKGAIVFGLQRVPSVARLVEYGKSVCATGYRKTLYVAALPKKYTQQCCRIIADGLQMKCEQLPDYLMLISHKLLLKVLYHLIYQPFRGFR